MSLSEQRTCAFFGKTCSWWLETTIDEQALFKERIRFLDKKIRPGLKKLHWALKGASAFFITECRIHASKVQTIVNDFKASTLTIGWRAQEISETLL
uniref:dynein axonemal heavy chain 2-like n=1 Tax=Panthera onca TaxID=9690 RepID=UPI00295401D8